MKLENQVCSLDQAKRLKELGVRQDVSIAIWYEFPKDEYLVIYRIGNLSLKEYSAFTVAEMGQMLPTQCHSTKCSNKNIYWEWVDDGNELSFPGFMNEAECRASHLITLLELGKLSVEEVNKRLED